MGTEDDTLLPRQGWQAQVTHELAGLGGNVNFIKHEAQARLAATLPWDVVRARPGAPWPCARACGWIAPAPLALRARLWRDG